MSPARRSGADQTRFTRLAETAGPRILGYLARRIDPPGEAAPAADEMIAVRDALGRLAPDDRELLTLVAWDGLRADQAAAILNISGAAARQRLVRARRRLRAELDTGPDATTVNPGPPTFTPTDTWPRSAFKR